MRRSDRTVKVWVAADRMPRSLPARVHLHVSLPRDVFRRLEALVVAEQAHSPSRAVTRSEIVRALIMLASSE